MHIAISNWWDNGTQRALIEGQRLAISHGAGSAISTVRFGSGPSSTERRREPSRTTLPTSAITAGFSGDQRDRNDRTCSERRGFGRATSDLLVAYGLASLSAALGRNHRASQA